MSRRRLVTGVKDHSGRRSPEVRLSVHARGRHLIVQRREDPALPHSPWSQIELDQTGTHRGAKPIGQLKAGDSLVGRGEEAIVGLVFPARVRSKPEEILLRQVLDVNVSVIRQSFFCLFLFRELGNEAFSKRIDGEARLAPAQVPQLKRRTPGTLWSSTWRRPPGRPASTPRSPAGTRDLLMVPNRCLRFRSAGKTR